MVNTLFGLTPADHEWPTALCLAGSLHVYERNRGAKLGLTERLFREKERRIEKPSPKFLHGLNTEGVAVYRLTQNAKACQEWVDLHSTTWDPPSVTVWYTVYLAGEPGSDPIVMPCGPLIHVDLLTQAGL